jgi:hypothetical protein
MLKRLTGWIVSLHETGTPTIAYGSKDFSLRQSMGLHDWKHERTIDWKWRWDTYFRRLAIGRRLKRAWHGQRRSKRLSS